MHVNISHEQQQLVENLVASGRFASIDEAITEGIRLLEGKEHLRAQIQIGIEQANRNEVEDHDTVFTVLRALCETPPSTE